MSNDLYYFFGALFIAAVIALVSDYRKCKKTITDLRFFIDETAYKVRVCDLCGYYQEEVEHDVLFSKEPLVCQACLDRHSSSIPVHKALDAMEHREQFLKRLGFRYVLRSKPTIIPLKDSWKALHPYERRACQGDASAQYVLGVLYATGRGGVDLSPLMAYKWLTLAKRAGVDGAADRVRSLTPKMTPAQIAEAQQWALEWKPASTKQ